MASSRHSGLKKTRAFRFLSGATPRGSCNNTLLRRVLRRFSISKCFLEGFVEGACKGFSVKTRFLEGFLEGSVV